MLRAIAFASAALFASTAAFGADNGIYVGGAVSKSRLEFDSEGFHANDNVTRYKVIAGIRPLDWLAAEVSYVDFGTFESQITPTQHATYELQGIDVLVLGLW